jgi:preprotein translocase subunit SecF
MRFFQNADYPFLEWRFRAYVITAIMLAVGIAGAVMNVAAGRSWLNYNVDFTGGTEVQIQFDRPVPAEQIRAAAAQAGYRDWEITRFGTDRESLIRMPAHGFTQEAGQDAQTRVNRALGSRFQAQGFKIVRTEAVGPKAGEELQGRALLAILLSFVATLIYLAIRFEWRFGLAAVVATAHDVLITMGFLTVTRTEVSLGTVAAVLTVLGYSLHDTIIVFDRVREDLGKPRGGRTFIQVLDRAINETLPRTTLTVLTVLVTLMALLVFGGPVIRPFVLVMVLGISIGTFSSIFVASPVLYEIERRFPRKESKKQTAVRSTSRSKAGTAA